MDIKGNILQTLEVVEGRLTFWLVEESGIYSVYHRDDGSYGQKNFGNDKEQAEQHLDCQRICSPTYKELVAKRTKLISRIAPISNKLDATSRQIDTLIIR